MFQALLTDLLRTAATELGYPYPDGVSIAEPPAHIPADAATNIALQLAKTAGQPPREVAERFAEALRKAPEVSEVSLAGPGFVNVTLSSEYLMKVFSGFQRDPRQGVAAFSNSKNIIDYGGPNVAKPLHVGHLRSSVLGEAIKGIARFAGDQVTGDIHLGDWGTPMGMLLAQLEEQYPDWPYFQDGATDFSTESPITMADLQALYPQAAGRFKVEEDFKQKAQQATAQLQQGNPGYRALWQHFVNVSVADIKTNMDRLDVTFELWNGESAVHDLIVPMLSDLAAKNLSEESEGATIVPLGDELVPLMLTKSDGAFLYSTTDMATLIDRTREHYDKVWYVVDQRQKLHFQQLFAAARKTGIVPDSMQLEHFGFGTVNGPDGRPFKTRDGNAMQLKDLLDLAHAKATEKLEEAGVGKEYPQDEQAAIVRNVAIASLKFADLINHRASDYSFDVERFMSFEGKTGPYLLYTVARINSILRKFDGDLSITTLSRLTEHERPLILRLMQFGEAVADSYASGQPHILADHLYQLATEFNHFYHHYNILQESDPEVQAGWLALAETTVNQLKLGLSLLAIPVPDRM